MFQTGHLKVKVTDLNRPIDKRTYKGTFPTCHDFNQCSATSEGCSLLIGFSAGQIQLIDPFRKDGINRLFNDEVNRMGFGVTVVITTVIWIITESFVFYETKCH